MTMNPYQPPASPTDLSLVEAARLERRRRVRSEAWHGAKFGGQLAAVVTSLLAVPYLIACVRDLVISELLQVMGAIAFLILLSTLLGALAAAAVTSAAAWAGVGRSARLSDAAREVEPRS